MDQQTNSDIESFQAAHKKITNRNTVLEASVIELQKRVNEQVELRKKEAKYYEHVLTSVVVFTEKMIYQNYLDDELDEKLHALRSMLPIKLG